MNRGTHSNTRWLKRGVRDIHSWLALAGLALPSVALAQTAVTPPALGAPGVSCVISAINRASMVSVDGGYELPGIPANTGALRGRVTCSDGSVGQTPMNDVCSFHESQVCASPRTASHGLPCKLV
jgi:hypothetical protein